MTADRGQLEDVGLGIVDRSRPSASVWRFAWARLLRLRSTASRRACGNLCAVSIACWPVPQPAIRMSTFALPRLRNSAAGNLLRRNWSMVHGRPGARTSPNAEMGFPRIGAAPRPTRRPRSASTPGLIAAIAALPRVLHLLPQQVGHTLGPASAPAAQRPVGTNATANSARPPQAAAQKWQRRMRSHP